MLLVAIQNKLLLLESLLERLALVTISLASVAITEDSSAALSSRAAPR